MPVPDGVWVLPKGEVVVFGALDCPKIDVPVLPKILVLENFSHKVDGGILSKAYPVPNDIFVRMIEAKVLERWH